VCMKDRASASVAIGGSVIRSVLIIESMLNMTLSCAL